MSGSFGIPGYKPTWYSAASSLIAAEAETLRGVIGTRVEAVLGAFDESGEWWADAPVILKMTAGNLEICAMKLSELAATMDSIDTDLPFFWCGDETTRLTWRGVESSALHRVAGIAVVECKIDDHLTDWFGEWALVGLEFKVGSGYLTVLNGLDENQIGYGEVKGQEFRKTEICQR